MSFTLRPAVLSDAEAMAEIYMTAFSDDLISLKVFPRSDPTSYTFWLDMLREEIPDPNAHFLVVTTKSPPLSQPRSSLPSEETIIAFAKWNSPQHYPESSLPEWPPGADIELANHFFGALVQKKKDIMGDKMYWYLELVATMPEWQGKGAAGMLLRWGLERADAEGIEAYLEGSPVGVPVYRRFGFGEVGRLVIGVEGLEGKEGKEEFVEVFMVREARGNGVDS